MPDQKKIENGMKHCIDLRLCAGCPYSRYAECTMMLLKDLYAVLEKTPEELDKESKLYRHWLIFN